MCMIWHYSQFQASPIDKERLLCIVFRTNKHLKTPLIVFYHCQVVLGQDHSIAMLFTCVMC